MAQMSGSDDAGDRTGRYFHEAVRADDPSVRQHDGRTRGDPESHVPGIRHGQHGPGRQRIDDSGIGIVLHLHEPAGTSGGVYYQKEFEKLKAWAQENVREGFDKNPENLQKSREQKDADWEFTLKMYLIIKDLMNGNPNLPEGCEEEMVGHNAIAGGFQGQRQWTDFYPNCDFPEAMLNT